MCLKIFFRSTEDNTKVKTVSFRDFKLAFETVLAEKLTKLTRKIMTRLQVKVLSISLKFWMSTITVDSEKLVANNLFKIGHYND
jgi:hypothetical protein